MKRSQAVFTTTVVGTASVVTEFLALFVWVRPSLAALLPVATVILGAAFGLLAAGAVLGRSVPIRH